MKLALRAMFFLVTLAVVPLARTDVTPRVLNGIDVLRRQNFLPLSGKRVGLITNHTGLAADGAATLQLLHSSRVCKLAAVFSPEHGLGGTLDSKIDSSTDQGTALPVYSLYGETTRPTAEMLQNLDALVFDIQDVGARFYTYITTMGYCMEEAARANIPFYVLDRPNPIGGEQVEGPMLDPDKTSFTGYMPMPVRHGMTVGELARYFNAEKKIGAQLHVVEMKGWLRSQFFWDTGQLWISPSPNMRTITAAILYPGVCLLEQTNVSVGRGTDRPFEVLGAPWIEPRRFAAELGKQKPPGVEATPVFFTPESGKHKGTACGGLSLTVVDPGKLNSVLLGLSLIAVLHRLYPGQFEIERVMDLMGNAEALRKLKAGETPADVLRADRARTREFLVRRKAALIY